MRSSLAVFAVLMCIPALMADDYEQEPSLPVSGWDPTIRNHTSKCDEMAVEAKDYCKLFHKCCTMNYDKLNGDKCQIVEEVCDGQGTAICIWKNCTEMITTTTTTTTTPEPSLNSAGLLAGVTSVGIALLFC